MDVQTLFNIAFGFAGALGGWILNVIWSEQKALQKADQALADKVASIEVLVAGRYITREEFQLNINRLFSTLDDIKDKLSEKADR